MAATVARVVELSPTFRRVTFTGPELSTVADNRFDQRFKMLLPTRDGGRWPPCRSMTTGTRRGVRSPMKSALRCAPTPSARYDPTASEFDVDIALHGRIGPASAWAMDAVPGDEIVVCVPHTGYSGDFHGGVDWRPPPHVEQLLIAADETALPAVSGIFERLGRDARGVAVVEVPHPDDARALSTPPPGVELIVVARGSDAVGTRLVPAVVQAAGALLTASATKTALEDIDIDEHLLWEVPTDDEGNPLLRQSPLYAWLAGEAGPIKQLRRHLVSELGVDRRAVAFMGYWRSGRPEM